MKLIILLAAAVPMIFLSGCEIRVKRSESENPISEDAYTAQSMPSGEISDEASQETSLPEDTEASALPSENISENIQESEQTLPAATDVEIGENTASQTTEETSELKTEPEYIFATEDDYFFIVNKSIMLPDDYYIETDYVQGSYELEKTAAYYCKKMFEAALEDGIKLKVLSAYRTVDYQRRLFEQNVKSRMEDQGMSYEDAYYDVSINIAPPGGSEHNAGLAVDIVTEHDWDTYEEFEDTEEFAWLRQHAAEYGFIMRYPKEKEEITGYIYEPWHYRYVGTKYSFDVESSGLCLEEYFEKYVTGPDADKQDSGE